MEHKTNKIVNILAWVEISSFVLLVLVVIISGADRVAQANSTSLLYVVPLAFLAVANLVYPIAILRQSIKVGNYSFLKSPLHYVALPILVYMWIAAFV